MATAMELAFYGYLGGLGILVCMVLYAVTRWVASQNQFPRELREPRDLTPHPGIPDPMPPLPETTPYRSTPTCPRCGQPVQTTPK